MIPIVITVASMGAIILLFAGVYIMIGPDRRVEERLGSEQTHFVDDTARVERSGGLGDRFNSQLKQARFGSKLSAELVQAGSQVTLAEFVSINAGLIIVSFLVGMLIGGTVIAGLALGGMACFGPRMWIKMKKAKRRSAFQEQLPDVLSLIVGSLRAGYGLIQAMKLVSQEMPDPSKAEYARVVNETSIGFTLEQALNHLVERMESDDLMMVVTAINIQNEVGGNLGNILESIAETIRSRVKLQGEVRTMTSMQRATGYLLAAMPFFLGIVLIFISPEYIMQMFVFPWYVIPAGAVISMIFGLVLMNRITKIDI